MIDIGKYKYKLEFFNVKKNEDQRKLFDNYGDWATLYYTLLGLNTIKDLKAFKFDKKVKDYREVINV